MRRRPTPHAPDPHHRGVSRLALALAVVMIAVAACTADGIGVVAVPEGVSGPGFAVSVVVDGLIQPTQISFGEDGLLLIAQLNGGENENNGQIISFDRATGERRVVIEGLDKPTGVAWFQDQIWVMERRSLSRVGLDGEVDGGILQPVLTDLPFNGRSEGTLTTTDDGQLLYTTTGSLDGGAPSLGSGSLFALDGNGASTLLASGLKNAYGHAVSDDGQIWVTEVSDGLFDGDSAQDELITVDDPSDHGWPWCVGDNRFVVEFADSESGQEESDCQAIARPVALFEEGATPTSVVRAPWDPDSLVVALWNRGTVVVVPIGGAPASPGQPSILEGVTHPQHLLSDGASLLVVDFDRGLVLQLSGKPGKD